MKKNNTLKVVLIAILVAVLLTWLLPISYFSGSLVTDARYPAGLFDIFNYPVLTFYYFGQIGIYVLIVGAFYAVFEKTGVYRKVCDRIAKLFKGKELIFFAVVITLLSTIVAFCGFSYELILVLPFLASIILLMGYDRMSVALTLVGSIAVGFIGSLFAKPVYGVYMETLSTNYTDLIWFRVIMLVIGMGLLFLNVFLHIRKLKKNKKDDDTKELIAEKYTVKNKKGKARASWPAVVIFDLVLVLMVFTAIDYSGAFGVSVFDTMHEAIMNFAIGDFKLFANIIGSTMTEAAIGTWTSIEFTSILLMATIVLAIIYRIKLSDLFDTVKEGAKKFGLAALLMIICYTVLITVTNHPIVLTILKPLMNITNGFNALTLSLSTFITSVFYIDPYYTASAVLPYITSIIEDTTVYPLVGFVLQSMQGLALLIAPTSFTLLGIISYLKVNYTDWFKKIWLLFLELLVVAFVLFIVIMNIA